MVAKKLGQLIVSPEMVPPAYVHVCVNYKIHPVLVSFYVRVVIKLRIKKGIKISYYL